MLSRANSSARYQLCFSVRGTEMGGVPAVNTTTLSTVQGMLNSISIAVTRAVIIGVASLAGGFLY